MARPEAIGDDLNGKTEATKTRQPNSLQIEGACGRLTTCVCEVCVTRIDEAPGWRWKRL